MNPSTTIGRHKISSRFTANVRIAYIEYPTSEELLPVYADFMKTIFSHPSFGGSLANSAKKLSQFLIELFSNVKNNFSIDEHRHYLFTPRDITQLIFSLLRYDIRDAQSLVEVLIYESSRIFKDRLVDKQSKAKFDSILYQLLRTHLKYNDKLVDTYFISKIAS
jgi:dynein heavy chain 2